MPAGETLLAINNEKIMKIDMLKEIEKESLLSHFLLEINKEAINKIAAEFANKKCIVDVIMTVNDNNVPIKKVIKGFEKQIDSLIKEKAIDLLREVGIDIDDLFEDLKERVKAKIKKYPYSWEK